VFSTVAQRAELIVHQPRFQPHRSPAVSWAMHWVNRQILSVHAEEEDEADATADGMTCRKSRPTASGSPTPQMNRAGPLSSANNSYP
jgi:hypothetical protein